MDIKEALCESNRNYTIAPRRIYFLLKLPALELTILFFSFSFSLSFSLSFFLSNRSCRSFVLRWLVITYRPRRLRSSRSFALLRGFLADAAHVLGLMDSAEIVCSPACLYYGNRRGIIDRDRRYSGRSCFSPGSFKSAAKWLYAPQRGNRLAALWCMAWRNIYRLIGSARHLVFAVTRERNENCSAITLAWFIVHYLIYIVAFISD